jgi:3-mercaptopyruvate sulfurtransferase SseA
LRGHSVCEQVRVLAGGWNGWITAGGPVATGKDQETTP